MTGPNSVTYRNFEIRPLKAIAINGTGVVSLTFPDDFIDAHTSQFLNFSNSGTNNTLTVSTTVSGDTSNDNDVESLVGIDVYAPAVASLSESSSSICAGGSITYTINLAYAADGVSNSPSGTPTYTFKVNGAIVQQVQGDNNITFSGAG